MTTNSNGTFLLAGILLAALSLIAQPAPKTKPVVATLALSAPTGSVRSGSKVELSIVVTDISETDVSIELWHECTIDIRDEKGDLAPETDLGAYQNGRRNPDGTSRSPGQVITSKLIYRRLKPGEGWEWHQDIAQRYKPLSPGKYTVQATTSAFVWSTKAGSGPITSNIVTMTAVP